MTKLGLARGTVSLVPYQTEWHELFVEEATLIKNAIGTEAIEHVGSTSVPGLLAKPIIDIAVLYPNKNQASAWVSSLEGLGYQYKGEQGVSDRFFFVKGPEDRRKYYLHLVDEAEFDRLISFREALRSNPQLAKNYSNLKVELAKKHSGDRKIYTHNKEQFINKVLSDLSDPMP